MRTLSLDRARRLALHALGFGRPRPAAGTRRDVRHLRRVLRTTGVVQLDSVNVLARAHELPFWSRLGPHDRQARDAWLWRSREAFEGWAHVASIAPMELWPTFAHRRADMADSRRSRRLEAEHPGLLDAVLAEVTEHGPVSVQELSDPGRRTGPWWGNPKGKVALDQLFARGDLAVHDRTAGFVTVYDLAERVVPEQVRQQPTPSVEQTHRELLLRAARAQGLGTAGHLADHYRSAIGPARRVLAELAAAGELDEVRVVGWGAEPVYVHPSASATRRLPARTLVSPFDPLIWHRGRTEALFDFHYRIEIYVPQAQRIHGYYVLPFLLGDRLVGRVDLKADRGRGRLLVRGAFGEPGVDRTHVTRELVDELRELAGWLGLGEVAPSEARGDLVTDDARGDLVTDEARGDLVTHLRRALD
jgi:uncharacterized protein